MIYGPVEDADFVEPISVKDGDTNEERFPVIVISLSHRDDTQQNIAMGRHAAAKMAKMIRSLIPQEIWEE